jgi:hypothetical protein
MHLMYNAIESTADMEMASQHLIGRTLRQYNQCFVRNTNRLVSCRIQVTAHLRWAHLL